MAENDNVGDSGQTLRLQFLYPASWVQAKQDCARYQVPIENESRDDLTIDVARCLFEKLPPSLQEQFNLSSAKAEVKQVVAHRMLRLWAPRRANLAVKTTAGDDLLVRQLIPEHLLPRD